VPSALALGLFAGLAEFVPIVGPIVSAVPALIIALSRSYELALWVLLMFVVLQQIEGNLIQPLIQRRMVSLPPALTLFAVVVFGLLFGAIGVLLATPLTVTGFVLVRQLYIADALGDDLERAPA
jgi:predicted PurR-regulated permease PerM